VETSEVSLERLNCSIHTERQAVARCAECRRPTCLTCAIPFRGEVLCSGDAAKALGERAPEEAAAPAAVSRQDLLTGGVLVAALVLTIPPWHRFGPLDRPLSPWVSAWNPTANPWPTLGAALLATALLVSLFPRAFRLRTARSQILPQALLVTLAAIAVLGSVLGSPVYVQPTPAPYLFLGATGLALVLAAARWRRASRVP
jgi:hypothetical protein